MFKELQGRCKSFLMGTRTEMRDRVEAWDDRLGGAQHPKKRRSWGWHLPVLAPNVGRLPRSPARGGLGCGSAVMSFDHSSKAFYIPRQTLIFRKKKLAQERLFLHRPARAFSSIMPKACSKAY